MFMNRLLIRNIVMLLLWVPAALAGGVRIGQLAPKLVFGRMIQGQFDSVSSGKPLLLEFWATWCSPCQKSMADLQLDFTHYPNWKGKVVLIAASMDDTADIADKRIQSKGWNQTHNVWLQDKALQSYHVGGIPFAYVIDAEGNIVVSGSEESLNLADIVSQQLEAGFKSLKSE